ncbi:MAG: hypothetical protein JXR30_00110 [Alphaproteobacteria bacterium]|nr:hypothetical protein [Alphaproteobacteria bacterium]
MSMGAVNANTSTMMIPKVPTYQPPALPPTEAEMDEQKELEKEEEDPTKKAIKGAAIGAGVLVAGNLVVKSFSSKYAKEQCLGQNVYGKFTDAEDNEAWIYVWDSSFSLKNDESTRCHTCCTGKKNGATLEEIQENQEKCVEDNCQMSDPDDLEECKKECESRYNTLSASGCSSTGDICDKSKDLSGRFDQQMKDFCSGKDSCP